MFSLSRVALWLVVFCWNHRSVSADVSGVPSAVVDLGYARYQGVPNAKGNIDFLGIRYAAPPGGINRFREPQAPAKVNGIQLANNQPNVCVQPFRGNDGKPSPPPAGIQVSEDCLFLNVVVPGTKLSSDSRLPVVVWIHGGANLIGSASYPGPFAPDGFYDGNDLVERAGGKAIVVLLQYRLGLYGFLSSADVKQNGALNAGLLDQQFALNWVQHHIHKFGGDPHRVTLWGESAGANAVVQHLIANGGHTTPPLFSTAILSSIALPPQYQYDAEAPEALYSEVVRLAGCGSATGRLQCLRGTNASLLEDINVALSDSGFSLNLAFKPVVDGSFITKRPLSAFQNGELNTKHVLVVANTWEGAMFVDPALANTLGVEGYLGRLFPGLPEADLSTAADLYSAEGGTISEQIISSLGESIFLCPGYSLLRSLNDRGYKGHFAIPPALHSDDLNYYFPSISPTGAPYNNSAYINTFAGSFLDFAINQTPNVNRPGSLLPQWKRWSEGSQNEMVFNRTGATPAITLGLTPSGLHERCRYWDSVSASSSQ